MGIKTATDQTYKELISSGFTIVDFYSTTCVPCKMFARILEDISLDFPFINIVKVNISNDPVLGTENKIEAVPTVLFTRDGRELDREVGLLSEEAVLEKISRHYYGGS